MQGIVSVESIEADNAFETPKNEKVSRFDPVKAVSVVKFPTALAQSVQQETLDEIYSSARSSRLSVFGTLMRCMRAVLFVRAPKYGVLFEVGERTHCACIPRVPQRAELGKCVSRSVPCETTSRGKQDEQWPGS